MYAICATLRHDREMAPASLTSLEDSNMDELGVIAIAAGRPHDVALWVLVAGWGG